MIRWSNTGSILQLPTVSLAATTLLCWQSTANRLQLGISAASEWDHTMSHSFLHMVKKIRKFTFIQFISIYLLLFLIFIYYSKTENVNLARRRLIVWCGSLMPDQTFISYIIFQQNT